MSAMVSVPLVLLCLQPAKSPDTPGTFANKVPSSFPVSWGSTKSTPKYPNSELLSKQVNSGDSVQSQVHAPIKSAFNHSVLFSFHWITHGLMDLDLPFISHCFPSWPWQPVYIFTTTEFLLNPFCVFLTLLHLILHNPTRWFLKVGEKGQSGQLTLGESMNPFLRKKNPLCQIKTKIISLTFLLKSRRIIQSCFRYLRYHCFSSPGVKGTETVLLNLILKSDYDFPTQTPQS